MLLRINYSFILTFGILIGLFSLETKGQDPQFTQFYANPLYLNPAFAGSKLCPRFSLNYRNQWPAIPGQYVTYSASYDQHIPSLSGGIGALVYNDQAGSGALRTTNISGIYSYTLNISRQFSVRAGLQATFFQRSMDFSGLTFGDMIDERYGFIYETQETPGSDQVNGADFSVGFLGYSENIFVGFAVHHLTEPNESFFSDDDARLYRKYTFHAGANIPFNRRYPKEGSISPNILYKRQGPSEQFMVGLYGKKGPFVAGLWYRNRDAFALLGGIQIEHFRFGYSYDITVSQLTNEPGGSHEISVGIQLKCRNRPRRFRSLSCPEF